MGEEEGLPTAHRCRDLLRALAGGKPLTESILQLLNKKMKVVFQGIPGSFSHTAAVNLFGQDHIFIGVNQFRKIFELVKEKSADRGVVPIENSLAGSVYENYDLLSRFKLPIVGEYYLEIEHNLLGIEKSVDFKDIKEVYSHPKALEQCITFFEKHPWIEKKLFTDTAGAAKFVADSKDPTKAAIASENAAKLYKLPTLKKNIEDNPFNFTRFLVIASKNPTHAKIDKCSLVFTVKHVPGSLVKALKVFADHTVNLVKIESRPIHGKPFEYLFYVDLEFSSNKDEMKSVVEEFKLQTQSTTILGYYQSFQSQIK